MLGFTVLGRSVGARHAEMDAMSEEKHAHAEVVELAAVVALDGLDNDAELSTNMSEEVLQSGESVRLLAQRKCPQIMRAVIENKKIVFVSRNTRNRRGP